MTRARPEDAVAAYSEAIALDPDPETLAAAYAIRGVSLLKLGGIDEAKADLVRVTSLLPSTHQLYGWADQLLTELNSAN
jgi:tetratricopeptide (TPR) repeat protein